MLVGVCRTETRCCEIFRERGADAAAGAGDQDYFVWGNNFAYRGHGRMAVVESHRGTMLWVRVHMAQGRLPVRARKTRSSTATERVKTVAVAAPGTATRAELPLSAGPAGFASLEDVSPGWSEMRVVFGMQDVAPRRVW